MNETHTQHTQPRKIKTNSKHTARYNNKKIKFVIRINIVQE